MGQVDSTYQLPEIVVLDSLHKRVCNTSSVSTVWVKEYRNPLVSVSELLNNHSFISLKNYGPGSLSTVSLRGHSASQTDIVLDGFSIQSNMNGVYDLSLIPSYFFESLRVDATSSSSELNGGIGGLLNINTDPSLIHLKSLKSEFVRSTGSFNDNGFYTKNAWKWKKNKSSISSIKAFFRSSENNYKYRNLNVAGTPKIKLENAAFRQYGLQQNNNITLKNGNTLSSKIWYINNHREIPPTLTETSSISFQDDELFNSIISWKKNWENKFSSEISGRYMYENIYYDSPVVVTDSEAWKYEIRGNFNYRINKKYLLSSFLGHEHSLADVDDYEFEKPKQDRSYANLSLDYDNDIISYGISLKEEVTDQSWSPLLLGIKGSYLVEKNNHSFLVKAAASKNYRRPTFNDLFWNVSAFSAGNPNLRPEEGWKENINLRYHFNSYNNSILFNLIFFNSNISDWILWTPKDNGQWTPANVKQVWSRGIETSFDYSSQINNHTFIQLFGRYSFTKTTNTDVEDNAQNTFKKQLIYVPIHAGNLSIDFDYKNFSFNYNNVLNGKRFITTDNSSSIPFYSISNVSFSYLFKKENIEIEPVIEVRNIFNKEYQIVANRPMPPLHFQGSIYFRFKK